MADRLDTLLHLLLTYLSEVRRGTELASHAHLSRAYAVRAFSARFSESPAAFRRRLRLERAAWTLKATDQSVTHIALDAGFDSLEGFTRAFRRAFGTSPSLFRRAALQTHLLRSPSGIHFQPLGWPQQTEVRMDILTHLLAFDEAFVRRALAQAQHLPARILDEPLGQSQPLTFEAPDRTLRELLDKMVFTKEVWVAAVGGEELPPADRDRSLAGLEDRMNQAFPAFARLAQTVQAEARWQQTFVDAQCEPPEVFPYGGMLAHVLSVDAHRRHVLSAWLWRLGVPLDADPMHFGQQPRGHPLGPADVAGVKP